jgi:DNA-binding NarL/FixJ family response regulator
LKAAFDEAFATGKAWSIEEALVEAANLANGLADSSPTPDEPNPAGLTARELEVLRLLSIGRSDREIADALFISRYTAMKHVSNILAKLEAGSRSEAAAISHRLGIV